MAINTTTVEIDADLKIFDKEKYNRLVSKKYAELVKLGFESNCTLGVAINIILDENPDLWRIKYITRYENPDRSPLFDLRSISAEKTRECFEFMEVLE